jgi:hypothetical protein
LIKTKLFVNNHSDSKLEWPLNNQQISLKEQNFNENTTAYAYDKGKRDKNSHGDASLTPCPRGEENSKYHFHGTRA